MKYRTPGHIHQHRHQKRQPPEKPIPFDGPMLLRRRNFAGDAAGGTRSIRATSTVASDRD